MLLKLFPNVNLVTISAFWILNVLNTVAPLLIFYMEQLNVFLYTDNLFGRHLITLLTFFCVCLTNIVDVNIVQVWFGWVEV